MLLFRDDRMWKAKLLRGISTFSGVWVMRLVGGLVVSVAMYRYFGPATMGILTIATSILGVLTFIVIETDMVVVPRLSGAGSTENLKRIVTANYVVKGLNRLAVAALLFASAATVEAFYRIEGLAAVIAVLAAGQVVGVLYGPVGPEVLQGLRTYREFFFQNLVVAVTQVGAIGLAIGLRKGLVDYLVYTVLLDAIAAVYGWYLYVRLRRRYGWAGIRVTRDDLIREIASLVRTSLPVSMNQLLYKSYLYCANLFAGKWYEPRVIGYLAFASNVVNKLNSAGHGTLSVVVLPFFAELREKERSVLWDLYERGYHTMLVMTAAATVLFTVFAREVTLVVGGARFLPAVILLQLLTVQLIFRVPLQILRMVYFAFEKTWTLFGIFALKTACEIALYFVLTIRFGEKGIVLAQVASYVVYAACFAWVGFRFLYPATHRRRAFEFALDLTALLTLAVGLIAVDVSLEPTLLWKVMLVLAVASLGGLWVRAGQLAGRRAYLVGGGVRVDQASPEGNPWAS